jgi:hypothetical protein
MIEKATKFNSKPPKVIGEPQAKAREPSDSLYASQFRQYWNEYKQKLDWRTQGDNAVWKTEQGEIPLDASIVLFVNLWKDDKLYITLNHEYMIADTPDELRESWRDMFNRYIRAVNASTIRVTSPRVVDTPSEREKNLATRATVYRLAAPEG